MMLSQQEYIGNPHASPQVVMDEELPLARIYANERKWADRVLFTQPWDGGHLQQWTWKEALAESRRMATWLKAQGWPAGSRIVLLSKNSAWWIMADFAIWMAGYVSVPLFPAAQDASLIALFRHSEPVACFLGHLDNPLPKDEVFDHLTWVTLPTGTPELAPSGAAEWKKIVATTEPIAGEPARKGTDIATIIYTSGTTGQPKGVMQSFQALTLMGKSMEPALQPVESRTDRILSYLPLAHIAERAIVECNAIYAPLHVYFTEGQATFLEDLQRARATLFFSIPRLFVRFQQGVFEKIPEKRLNLLLSIPILGRIVSRAILKRLGLNHTRLVASGAASIPVALGEWYRKLGIEFVEGYGMTETGITHVPLPGRYRAGYVGNASPYAETRLAAAGPDKGEVQIQGAMNFSGYFRNPELTNSSFTADGYFRTGDSGEIDDQGRLRIVGRLKEEFKTAKGKYVIPAGIERRLLLSPLFESVAVFGAGLTSPFVMAVLVPEHREGCADATQRTLIESEIAAEIEHVNQSLERHEQIAFFVISQRPWTTANSFLTPTLKVRRAFLEAHYAEHFTRWEQQAMRVLWLEEHV